jgi:hypothetical protein
VFLAQNPRSARKSPSRGRDFVLYIAIGLAVGISAVSVHGEAAEAVSKWGGCIGATAILFGYFIADSRPWFRSWQFWMLVGISFSCHVAVWTVILWRVSECRGIWFAAMILELPPLVFLRNLLPSPD